MLLSVTEQQVNRIEALYRSIDEDSSGILTKQQVISRWGGGQSAYLFDALDTNGDNTIDVSEWKAFFSKLFDKQGSSVVEFALRSRRTHCHAAASHMLLALTLLPNRSFERAIAAQKALKGNLDAVLTPRRQSKLFESDSLDLLGWVEQMETEQVTGTNSQYMGTHYYSGDPVCRQSHHERAEDQRVGEGAACGAG